MEIDYLEDDHFKNETPFKKLQEPDLIESLIKFNKFNFKNLQRLQQQKLVHLRKKKNPLQLKQLVIKAKVDILKKNFIRKIRRGIVYNEVPCGLLVQEKNNSSTFFGRILGYLQNTEGLDFSPMMLCIWSFINIIQITIMVFIFSVQIAFPQTESKQYFLAARIFSITLYIIDMILNFITQRHEIGGNKKNLKQIAKFYISNEFIPDFFSIAVFPLSYAFQASTIRPIVLLIALFKLKNNLKRFQSFEFIYVKSNAREQYYALIKVFLLNFAIGHILSIVLNLITNLSSSQNNWHTKLNIENEDWQIKYAWGYYWGTNIMLTVGFGDICASNVIEAVCLIFIQTISCITLAYNINCVGSIIGQIKAENQEKKKRLKYFHRMCGENKISQELQQRINNFIEESYLLKNQFQLDEYEEVINSLPKFMQSQYRKQANKSLFDVGFFNSLNNKTILNLAQSVIRKIAHPDEILQKRGEIANFCILQKGCLGFTCKKGKSILNGAIIQKFQINKNEHPKILTLGFVKRKILEFDIKSLFYSIYYYLSFEQLIRNLGTCDMDYQFFLFMKDKDQSILGSNQIYKCKVCKDDYHTLFECPKYHYIPMKQVALANYFKKETELKVKRNNLSIQRCYRDYRCLLQVKRCQTGHDKYLIQNFDQDQINEMKNIEKYYYQKTQQAQSIHGNTNSLFQRKKNAFEMQFQKIEDILTKVSQLDFWQVQTDTAHNFKYYFKEFNSNRLIQFKTNFQRKKAKDVIFGVLTFKAATPQNSNTQPHTATTSHLSSAFPDYCKESNEDEEDFQIDQNDKNFL